MDVYRNYDNLLCQNPCKIGFDPFALIFRLACWRIQMIPSSTSQDIKQRASMISCSMTFVKYNVHLRLNILVWTLNVFLVAFFRFLHIYTVHETIIVLDDFYDANYKLKHYILNAVKFVNISFLGHLYRLHCCWGMTTTICDLVWSILKLTRGRTAFKAV